MVDLPFIQATAAHDLASIKLNTILILQIIAQTEQFKNEANHYQQSLRYNYAYNLWNRMWTARFVMGSK